MTAEVYAIKDPGLAEAGIHRIEWALTEMPVIRGLMQEFAVTRPLTGLRVGLCLHVTAETANLVRTLVAGGAEVFICSANPLSTQDEVAAALVVGDGIPVFARRGEDPPAWSRNLDAVLSFHPQITVDVGADLIAKAHERNMMARHRFLGGIEETASGVHRLNAMMRQGLLACPVIAVNDAETKQLFESQYGAGQSTLDGLMRATNLLVAGRVVVVAGYGWVGRGIAARARGLGARVIVAEVSPVRAMEAALEGFEVRRLLEVAPQAQVIITATGMTDVVDAAVINMLGDGCVLANAGHLDVEIDVKALAGRARERRQPRALIEEFVLEDGRRIRLIAEGRVINLAAAEGAPAAVMDITFANLALCLPYLNEYHASLDKCVHPTPTAIDQQVAQRKLVSMGLRIDELNSIQQTYLQMSTVNVFKSAC